MKNINDASIAEKYQGMSQEGLREVWEKFSVKVMSLKDEVSVMSQALMSISVNNSHHIEAAANALSSKAQELKEAAQELDIIGNI